ncbi:MAG: DMT family transporter, partial [Longimicrobiales bacterium]
MRIKPVYVALISVQLMFATLPIAAKIALRELSSPALCFLRVAGAALVFAVLQHLLVGERIRGWRDYMLLAWYSMLGVTINQTLYITGLTMTTATAAQTLVAAGPAMTLGIAILLKKEQPTSLKWIGIALASSGALLLIGLGIQDGHALGNLLVTANVAVYSLYLVVSRGILKRYHPLTVITWIFILGAVGLAPFGMRDTIALAPHISWNTFAALLWIIVFPSVGGYYLNMWALTIVESSVVSTFVYLQPIGTALLAMHFLGEDPSMRIVPAVALIFLGVMVAIRSGK